MFKTAFLYRKAVFFDLLILKFGTNFQFMMNN